MPLNRPIQTRFRFGFGCDSLNLATQSNSPDHSPKGTPSGILSKLSIALRLFVSIRFQVLFHSPNRGSFHLSLTVLVHYRSPRVFSLGKWASQLPAGLACPAVLKDIDGSLFFVAYGVLTLFGGPFQCPSAKDQICNSPGPSSAPVEPYNPRCATAATYHAQRV